MRDKFNALFWELKWKIDSMPTHWKYFAAYMTGVTVCAVVDYFVFRSKVPPGRTFVLPKKAYEALINDETNFVHFTFKKKPEQVFRITYVH